MASAFEITLPIGGIARGGSRPVDRAAAAGSGRPQTAAAAAVARQRSRRGLIGTSSRSRGAGQVRFDAGHVVGPVT